GAWSYTLGAASEALTAGQVVTDSFMVSSSDTTDTQLVTVTITGVNGVATITGTSTGAATEDSAAQVTGSLSVTDEDTGEALFIAQADTDGTYGGFTLATNGNWTYDLDNTNTAVQALPDGATLTDSFTATSADSTGTQLVTVTITGVNGVAIITGTSTGSINEDVTTAITGTLNVTDEDTGEATFTTQTNTAGTYGLFSIDTTGAWSYTLGAASEALTAGQVVTDSFAAASADGTTQQVVITITGVNGIATITGTSTGSINEDVTVAITGDLNVTDEDAGEATFTTQTNAAGTYGVFTIDATGAWSYTLGAASEALTAGQVVTDSFMVSSSDTTDTQLVTVTITGVNGVATITGTSTGAATEDSAAQVTGSLSVTDEDTGEALFIAQADTDGTYGGFTLATNGNWTYDLDNTNTAVQALPDGATLTDSFTATSADSTGTQLVTVTITGVNGVATITGTSTGAATEDSAAQVTGSLSVTDEDTGEALFIAQADTDGTYGGFTLATNGNWTYDLDNTNTAVQALPDGATLTDSFTATSADSTGTQLVTVTITGVNGIATITGTSTGSINEDVTVAITGDLNVTDEDAGEATFTTQTNAAGTYGVFTIDATGAWSYTLGAASEALTAGQVVTDSFMVSSSDTTDTQLVTVTITGVNGVATITGTSTGAATEDSAAQVTGSLSVTD
ncbi:VCBS domain-containing protein, partial [Colwellia sp. E2M01]|uniref:VCBS domain-containing protein n=1 Tax=Colwellia sp. E2M01 TaxID=2841561 RepID=UPI001C0829C5